MKIKGTVFKKIGKHLYLRDLSDKNNKNQYSVEVSGNLKFNNNHIILGDNVEADIVDNNVGVVTNVLPRKNEIYRPKIANIDQVFIISSLCEPQINFIRLNKYIIFCLMKNISLSLCFTKLDLVKDGDSNIDKVKSYSKFGFNIFLLNNISAKIDTEMVKLFENKISVFTGMSGVGKSTLLNKLNPDLNLTTNEISKALNAGKHTTTFSQFVECYNGYIADTPGFSSFELIDFEVIDLARTLNNLLFVECKFRDCLHINDTPQCAVADFFNKNENVTLNFFYKDYQKIIYEIINKRG